MDHHKKVLGIIYVVTASLTLLTLLVVNVFVSTLFEFILDRATEEDAQAVLTLIKQLLVIITWVVALFGSIPSIIAGIGLLNKQAWALTMALVLGCLKLLSFPIGTAIGVYSIWVYAENSRLEKEKLNVSSK
jgi:hypothetical protein